MRLTPLVLLCGCARGALALDPPELRWGEVDFQAEPLDCEGGCDPMTATLRNEGSGELPLRLPDGYDGEHLCIAGFDPEEPLELGVLAPGSSYVLEISVCGYLAGERDAEVSGALRLDADGEQVLWPWAFTPVRDFGEDTGP